MKVVNHFVDLLRKLYTNVGWTVQLGWSMYNTWLWVQQLAADPLKATLSGFMIALEAVLTFAAQCWVYCVVDLKDQIFSFGKNLQAIQCVVAVMLGLVFVVVIFSFANMWLCRKSAYAVRKLYNLFEAVHTIVACFLFILRIKEPAHITAENISCMQRFSDGAHILAQLPDAGLCIFLSVLCFFAQFFCVLQEETVLLRHLLRSLLCDMLVVNAVRYMDNQDNVLFVYCLLMLFITVPSEYLVPKFVWWTWRKKQTWRNFWWSWVKAIVIQDNAVALPMNEKDVQLRPSWKDRAVGHGRLKLAAPFKSFLHLFSIVNCLWTICELCNALLSEIQNQLDAQPHAAQKKQTKSGKKENAAKQTIWAQFIHLHLAVLLSWVERIMLLAQACIVLCVRVCMLFDFLN